MARFFVFFFFQAEDGIRVRTVTGVQTCALPIYRLLRGAPPFLQERRRAPKKAMARPCCRRCSPGRAPGPTRRRSEERRVGKESRTRRGAQPYRKQGECKPLGVHKA